MLIALLTASFAVAHPAPQQSPQSGGTTAAAPAQQPADDQPRGIRFVWNDHPSLRAGSQLRVDFLGKFQWDARQPGDDPQSFRSTELHRARIGIEARLFRHFEINLERELTEREIEGRATHPWKDAYLNVNYSDYARVRMGKFKIPFGLDQLTGISNLDFLYRSLAGTYLAPARDIGVMVYGDAADNRINYWAGAFKQDGENARSGRIVGANETGAVRATVAPFRRPGRSLLDQLEIGSALAMSALSNDESVLPNGLRGRTTMSRYVFFEPVFVDGRRQRFEIEDRHRRVAAVAREAAIQLPHECDPVHAVRIRNVSHDGIAIEIDHGDVSAARDVETVRDRVHRQIVPAPLAGERDAAGDMV